jgi:hypothetical protein
MNWENVFADRHAGETCLIIGNGPSLRNVPNGFLGKYPTFGTNRIYLLPDFTATYYCAVNPLVIEQSAIEINKYGAKAKFIAATEADKIKDCYPLHSAPTWTFSYNPAVYIFEGFTVTYACMQLAFHMGFTTALLVWVDHSYKTDGPPNSRTTWQGDDPNHFDPAYFRGTVWNNPDLANSEKAYRLAEKAFKDAGRKIINLTEGSRLEIFKKGKIAKWM